MTSWTEKELKAQVQRLRSLPRNEEERPWKVLAPEFERVLGRVGEDDAHLKQVVDYVIDNAKGDFRFCPTPAELSELALQVSKKTAFRPDPDCRHCGGSGWAPVSRGGRTGVSKCDCWAERKTA